jgi:hypothetical protein
MTYARAPQITERETTHLWVDERTIDNAAWEDCGSCSALESVIASGHAAPATHFEEESLRLDAGYGAFGGTDVPKLSAGIKKRYGLDVVQVGSYPAFRAAFKLGWSAFVIVQPSRLPLKHILRQGVGDGFTGLHFIHLENDVAAPGNPFLLDPAQPAGYAGNRLAWDDLQTAYVGGAGLLPLAVLPITTPEVDMVVVSSNAAELLAYPAGTQLYDLAGKALAAAKVGRAAQPSPYGVSISGATYRVVSETVGTVVQVVLVKAGDAVASPAPTHTDAELTAAKTATLNAAASAASSAIHAL